MKGAERGTFPTRAQWELPLAALTGTSEALLGELVVELSSAARAALLPNVSKGPPVTGSAIQEDVASNGSSAGYQILRNLLRHLLKTVSATRQ